MEVDRARERCIFLTSYHSLLLFLFLRLAAFPLCLETPGRPTLAKCGTGKRKGRGEISHFILMGAFPRRHPLSALKLCLPYRDGSQGVGCVHETEAMRADYIAVIHSSCV